MRIRRSLKRVAVNLPGFGTAAKHLTVKMNPKVFVYHRFCDASDDSQHKMDVVSFGHHLDEIMKRYRVVSFRGYLAMAASGQKIPPHLAIITIDDGYRDFYHFAFPELKKRGLEATFFVTVNFINQNVWLWPDRLDYALKTTSLVELDIEFQGRHFWASLGSELEVPAAWRDLADWCLELSSDDKWRLIQAVESYLGVEPPECIPPAYEPVTWGELRDMAGQGIEIGCHTMNHPILSKVHPNELDAEIYAPKVEIESKLGMKVESFCYPNGRYGDINDGVVRTVCRAGYKGAPIGGYPDFSNLYRIPRISLSRDLRESQWKINGLEMLLIKIGVTKKK